jgi:hypothetical protein
MQNYENFFKMEKKVLQWKTLATAVSISADSFLSSFSSPFNGSESAGEDHN